MKKKLMILLSIVALLFTCNSSCPCSSCFHLFLYQNGTVVKEYDDVSNLYCSEGYATFFYQKQKYKFHMDFIAEPIPQDQKKE